MALQIIGTGQGRTGTMSLKLALEILGYEKCYHMFELFQHPEEIVYFEQAEKGEKVDWDVLFEGYKSAVDFPVIRYYKELMIKYPDAKLIHTTRDPDSWYKSASDTIFLASKPSLGRMLSLLLKLPFSSILRKRFRILKYNGSMIDKFYEKNLKNKEAVIKVFKDYNEDVLKSVPQNRLLFYDVKSGWEPLCKFLNIPVPSVPFPKSNSTDEFLHNVSKIASAQKLEG